MSSCGDSATDDDGTLPTAPSLPAPQETGGVPSQVTLPGVTLVETETAPTTDETRPPVDPPAPTTTPAAAPSLPPLTNDQLLSAVIDTAELGDGWTPLDPELSLGLHAPLCPPAGAPSAQSQAGAESSFDLGEESFLDILHTVTSYGSPADADNFVTALIGGLPGCEGVKSLGGNDFSLAINVLGAGAGGAPSGCDYAAAAEFTYTGPPELVAPIMYATELTVRCGRNVSVLTVFTSDPLRLAEIDKVKSLAAGLLAALPGSDLD
jgi:hypothetical protein